MPLDRGPRITREQSKGRTTKPNESQLSVFWDAGLHSVAQQSMRAAGWASLFAVLTPLPYSLFSSPYSISDPSTGNKANFSVGPFQPWYVKLYTNVPRPWLCISRHPVAGRHHAPSGLVPTANGLPTCSLVRTSRCRNSCSSNSIITLSPLFQRCRRGAWTWISSRQLPAPCLLLDLPELLS